MCGIPLLHLTDVVRQTVTVHKRHTVLCQYDILDITAKEFDDDYAAFKAKIIGRELGLGQDRRSRVQITRHQITVEEAV